MILGLVIGWIYIEARFQGLPLSEKGFPVGSPEKDNDIVIHIFQVLLFISYVSIHALTFFGISQIASHYDVFVCPV